jgi:short-subunit dehydrogenase
VTTALTSRYGPWGIVAGGSDGVGASFARGMASRGMNLVLVARRVSVLEAFTDGIRAQYGVEVRTVALDLSVAGAVAELAGATSDLEVGLFVYNATAPACSKRPTDSVDRWWHGEEGPWCW